MEKFKIAIVRWMVGLSALLLCTLAWGQPVPAVTQAQACNHWEAPIQLTLSGDAEVSVGRLAAILAEDLPPTAAQAVVVSGDFRNRLMTRSGSSHAATIGGLVASVYNGNDEAVRSALIRELVAVVNRAGRNRVKMDEYYTYCPRQNPDGTIERHPEGGLCADGGPARRAHRTRLLRAGFSGDFYAGSYPLGEDASSWSDRPGHALRVFIEPASARETYVVTMRRVYAEGSHPRPGARLCGLLPTLARLDPPTIAEGKRQVIDTVAALLVEANQEGDTQAVAWAANFSRGLYVRLAGLEALQASQDRERGLAELLSVVRGKNTRLGVETRAAHGKAMRTFYGALAIIIACLCLMALAIWRTWSWAKGKLESEFLRGAEDGVTRFCKFIEDPLAALLDLAKANMSNSHPVASRLKAFDGAKGLAAQVRVAPSVFFADLHEVLKTALNTSRVDSTSDVIEENRRLKAAAETQTQAMGTLEGLAAAIGGLVNLVHLLYKGELPQFTGHATLDQLKEAREMLVNIVMVLRRAVQVVTEERISQDTVVLSEEQVIQEADREPLVALLTRLATYVRGLREEGRRKAESIQRVRPVFTTTVAMLNQVRVALTSTLGEIAESDPIKATIATVLGQINQGLSELATASRDRNSSESGLLAITAGNGGE